MSLRRALVATSLLVVVAACGSSSDATPTTSGTPTSSGASVTTAAPTTPPATTASPAAPSSGTTPATTIAAATTADANASTAVTAYFDALGLPLTPDEATCLVGTLDAATIASLADAVANGAEASETTQTAVFEGIVTCEPQSYAQAQTEAIVSLGATSEADAACIVRANNALLRDDPAVLALAAGSTAPSDWPAEEKAKLRATLVTCVAGDVADRIIAGGDTG